VVAAFRKLVRENHPDRFKSPEEKAKAEELLKDITEAFNNLSNPGRRQEYDKSLAQPSTGVVKSPQEQVKEFLAQGLSRYRQGDLSSALSLFDHVIRVQGDNASALFHSGMIRLKNPKWRSQGADSVERAIRQEPYNADWVVEYAKAMITMGQQLRATKVLEVSAESNPASEEIRDLLAECLGGGSDKPGGFSLFGRKP
jgi:curved DNA-binding protein CbpA